MTGDGPEPRPESLTVGDQIRARRESLRLTGSALAARAGLTQAKVSRIENNRTAAAPDDVHRLATAMMMTVEEVDALVRLAWEAKSGGRAKAGEPELSHWRPASNTIAQRQADIEQIEATTRQVRVFQPGVIPGLLQVSDYAEAVMRSVYRLSEHADADLVAAIAGRMARQRVLAMPGKTFHFLLAEAALSSRLGSPETMLSQIRRIRQEAGRENVTISVIPFDAELSFPLVNGFEMLDDRFVMIDLYTMTLTVEVVTDLDNYRKTFDILAESATTEIDPVLDKYQDLYHRLAARR
ncbi:MAG TPA: helix-turn-helix transcriptional regulator [Actinoplanes sp.]|nr:helix-turn-helix transcriptional regulator [Actinoplanes sp.]